MGCYCSFARPRSLFFCGARDVHASDLCNPLSLSPHLFQPFINSSPPLLFFLLNFIFNQPEQDHKATDIAERTRIEAAGGFVVRKRVMGVLAVARSFGDFVLKKFVSAEPYTSTTKLDEEVS